MTKLKLGTIGTSIITDNFIEAALETDLYELTCVYSRTERKAESFASKYGAIAIETNLENFMKLDNLDVIYIASPNSLHYKQTILALKSGKHVIVEKPASISVEEWDEMLTTAKQNNVFVVEAARHIHDPKFKKIANEIQNLGTMNGAILSYAQYSSRYDKVLAGEEPNIFSLKFAGGALMDLGIYPIYVAVYLFGAPKDVHYFPQQIKTGADGSGTTILEYGTFNVTIIASKTFTSMIGMEFYGEKDTLLVDHVADMRVAKRVNAETKEEEIIELETSYENMMSHEAEEFAKLIMTKNDISTIERYDEMSEIAKNVSKILYDLRKKANIIFDFEK